MNMSPKGLMKVSYEMNFINNNVHQILFLRFKAVPLISIFFKNGN